MIHRCPVLTRMLAGVAVTWSLIACAADCERGRELYEQAQAAADQDHRIALLQRSTQACPDAVAFAELGLAHIQAGAGRAALGALRQARDVSETTAQQVQILALLAQASLLEQDLPEAWAAIERAFDLGVDPGDDRLQWIRDTRRAIDRQRAGQIMPARAIVRAFGARRAMSGSKGFIPAPRLDFYILFDFAQDRPNGVGQRQVVELADALAADGGRFLLIGHTDERGSVAYNQDLSERRAAAVRTLVVARHPALADRLRTEGRGERAPKYPDHTEEAWRLNRRVEVRGEPGS